jgi:hypothetical protein
MLTKLGGLSTIGLITEEIKRQAKPVLEIRIDSAVISSFLLAQFVRGERPIGERSMRIRETKTTTSTTAG